MSDQEKSHQKAVIVCYIAFATLKLYIDKICIAVPQKFFSVTVGNKSPWESFVNFTK